MQLPWRAAEAMHWQIGEVEMAQRANVPVFHLAGQQAAQAGLLGDRPPSRSPPSATSAYPVMAYSHTHNHSLPQVSIPQHQPMSPVDARLRRNSSGSSPLGRSSLRGRADSARSVPTTNRTHLPPVGELTGSSAPFRYTLPPVNEALGSTR